MSRENAKISDGIAPQLLSVTILENPAPRSAEDTLMIAFTEPVELQSLTTWPVEIAGVTGTINVVGKATTNNGGKSWLYVVTGNDNGNNIPIGANVSIKPGFSVVDNGMNAVDPAAACKQVRIVETPRPVPVKLAEMRENEGDGYADELYMLFEKRLRPRDMLDSFVVEWGMKNITRSFVTKADTSSGKIVPKDNFWTIKDSLSAPYDKWIDSTTKVTVVDTFSIVTITLNSSNGFPYGTTSGAYDGYGHVTPRLGPAGGFFDKFYYVVDKCPPVIVKANKTSSNSFEFLEVTMSEPLAVIDNNELKYIERKRGSQEGEYLRPRSLSTRNDVKELYGYTDESEGAVRVGDYVRLVPLPALSRYKDKAGNYPTEQNPWVIVSGAAAEKTKFNVVLVHDVTRPGLEMPYAGAPVASGEVFRATVVKTDGTETLMNLRDGNLTATATVLDTNIYKHAGPQFLVEITMPSAQQTDEFGQPMFDFDIKLSMDLYDNLGQFITDQTVRIRMADIGYDKISEDGVLRLNMEWVAPDGSPTTKSGRKLGTGAYIAKFDFLSKATYVSESIASQDSGSTYKKGDVIKTTDNKTKTFGFKRAKRK